MCNCLEEIFALIINKSTNSYLERKYVCTCSVYQSVIIYFFNADLTPSLPLFEPDHVFTDNFKNI